MPNTRRGQSSGRLMKQIGFGMRNSPMGMEGMGALMGFSGLPFLSKGAGAGKGSGSGPWMTVDPRNMSMFQGGWGYGGGGGSGSGGGGGGPSTGGEDPPYDPNDPNAPLPGDKFGKNLIPEWWKQWYRTQGQYGGVPPVDGLL